MVGCSEKENRYIPSEEIKSIYNKEELGGIQELVELFNSRVCESPNDLSCYRGVLRDIDGDMSLLFEMFDDTVSNKVGDFISKHPAVIWSECRSTLYAVNQDYQSPCILPETKFASYLTLVKEDSKIIKIMDKELYESGSLNINWWLSEYYILTELDRNDLNDQNINFLIAVGVLGEYCDYRLQLGLGIDRFETSGLRFL